MNETLITDVVAKEAVQQLADLDAKMEKTLEQFKSCATELAKGLKIPVEVTGDLERLRELSNTTMQRASQAAQQYTQQLQQQQQVIANTSNTISRQLMEQERLNKANREAYVEQQRSLDMADRILGTHEQNIRALTRVKREMEQLKAEYKAGTISAEEYTRRELELKTTKQELQKILNNETKLNQAAAGSYQQLSLQLERMKMAHKKLNDEGKSSAEGRQLEREIQNLDAHLKDLDADMGQFQRNVGNYAIAAQSAKSSLKELTETITQLTLQYEGLSDEEKNGVFGQQLKDNIAQLTEEASKYKDAIGDVKESIAKGASDTRLFDTLAESGKVLVSTLGMCSSAAQALGISNDSLQQSMLKVQQAMQAVQALTVIQNALQKQSNLMKGIAILQSKASAAAMRIETAAMQQATGATVSQTVAQKALNVVAKANPYLLLATAILAVVAAVTAWTSKTDDAKKHADALNESMKEQSNEYARNRAELARLQKEWDKLTSKKEREEWVKRNKDTFHNLGIEVNNAKQAENVLVKNTSAFVKAMSLRAQAAAYAAQATKEFQAAIENRTEAGNSRSNLNFFEKAWAAINYDTRYDENIDDAIDRYAKQKAGALYQQARQAEERAYAYAEKTVELQEQADASLGGAGITKYTGGGSTTTGGKGGATDKSDKVKSAEEIQDAVDAILVEGYKRAVESEEKYSKEWLDKEKKRIEGQRDYDMAAAEKKRDDLKKDIEASTLSAQEKKDKIADIERATQDIVKGIRDKATEDEKKAEEEVTNHKQAEARKEVDAIADAAAAKQAIRDVEYQNKVTELYNEYNEAIKTAMKKGEDTTKIEEHFNKEKLRIDNEYANETVKAQIDALKEEVEVADLSEEEREQLQQELTRVTGQLAAQRAQQEKEQIDKTVQNDEEAHKKRLKAVQEWVQRAGEAISRIGDFIGAMYDNQISKIDELLESEQERYDAEVEHIDYLAERGAITTEEAEIRKREAAAATAKKQEELEKKKAQIEYKKAVMEKMNSISQIGIATALGIMKASPNIPLMAFVGAMGAIQVATALAQPIKAYKEGTKGKPHPGGLALVGEGGSQELVVYDGKAWVTPDRPTLLDLPRGAEVFPDATQKDVLALGASLPMSVPRDRATGQPIVINDYSALESRVAANTKAVTKALREHQMALTRQLKRQKFNAYIASRI